MKKQLVSSVIVTVMLLYFMVNTSGSKVIFIPFLISAISMIGRIHIRDSGECGFSPSDFSDRHFFDCFRYTKIRNRISICRCGTNNEMLEKEKYLRTNE